VLRARASTGGVFVGASRIEPVGRQGSCCPGHRLIQIVAVDDVVAAELLLHIRERTVGRNRFALSDACGLSRAPSRRTLSRVF
jgi:hypothetical protein